MPVKLRSTVMEVMEHGERVYTIFLKTDSMVPRFLPGQFLHLALDEYNPGDFWPESRVFSIASSPNDRQILRITYAVKGQFTSRMEAELMPGREVWLKLPYGDFTVQSEKDVCLLAGGTGITAFTAFLTGLATDYSHKIYLFYGARRSDLLIYRTSIESIAKQCSSLHNTFLAEQPSADCREGRITADLVWQNLPDPLSVTYYLAGPPEMLRALKQELSFRGVRESDIITDAWE